MTDIKTITALLLATTTLAAADTKSAPKPAVAKPKATDPQPAQPKATDPKLAQLVGRWEGTSKFTLNGKTDIWTATSSCERTTVGPPILCNLVGQSGARRLEEVWLFGYEAQNDQYHLFMVNDWGEAYDHVAKWSDTGEAAFVYTGTRDGKAVREQYKLSFKPNELHMDGIFTVDGKTIGEGSMVLKRVP